MQFLHAGWPAQTGKSLTGAHPVRSVRPKARARSRARPHHECQHCASASCRPPVVVAASRQLRMTPRRSVDRVHRDCVVKTSVSRTFSSGSAVTGTGCGQRRRHFFRQQFGRRSSQHESGSLKSLSPISHSQCSGQTRCPQPHACRPFLTFFENRLARSSRLATPRMTIMRRRAGAKGRSLPNPLDSSRT